MLQSGVVLQWRISSRERNSSAGVFCQDLQAMSRLPLVTTLLFKHCGKCVFLIPTFLHFKLSCEIVARFLSFSETSDPGSRTEQRAELPNFSLPEFGRDAAMARRSKESEALPSNTFVADGSSALRKQKANQCCHSEQCYRPATGSHLFVCVTPSKFLCLLSAVILWVSYIELRPRALAIGWTWNPHRCLYIHTYSITQQLHWV